MIEKIGQDAAYPVAFREDVPIDLSPGMSKRFYAACSAMQGLLSNSTIAGLLHSNIVPHEHEVKSVIKASFEYADELLKQK